MCQGCYRDFYGSPTIVNEKTTGAVALIKRVYEYSCVGGNLHVELDDWNIEDEFFDGEFQPYDSNVSAAQLEAELGCFLAFKAMTVDERASALGLWDGLFTAA